MRLQVVDLELKARYWKAQYDIRHYSLESEKLQAPYNEYVEAQTKSNQQAYEKLMEQLNKSAEPATPQQEVYTDLEVPNE